MAVRIAGMLLLAVSILSAQPSWLPGPGCWAKVSLNKVTDVQGDFPPQFPSSRDVDTRLFTDYTGMVYNPYDGALGTYVIHGGGHQQYLGNEVYKWSLDDRLWHRASNPTYPGEVDLSDWTSYKEPPYTSALLNNYGELATNVPASNHSRWHPSIMPPGHGGSGPKGSLVIGFLSAIHTGGNGKSPQAHRFDFETGTWSRFSDNAGFGTYTNSEWVSCYDTTQRQAWRSSAQRLQRAASGGSNWTTVPLTGFNGTWGGNAMIHIPTANVIFFLRTTAAPGVLDAASPGASVTAVAVSGTPPPDQYFERKGGTFCPDLGVNGSILVCDYAAMGIYALAVPANPFTGTWAWSTLARNNTASGFEATGQYNRLQYVPALKSCIVSGGNSDVYAFHIAELGNTSAPKAREDRAGQALSASPNPFRSAARFSAGASAIDIFNAAGKQVARLEAGERRWEAGSLPEGVYVARASWNGRVSSCRLLKIH